MTENKYDLPDFEYIEDDEENKNQAINNKLE
jgi:hypothetical protein